MPRLLRSVARTAAIAGTATAVSNRVSRRQSARWAAQSQPTFASAAPASAPAPVPPPPQAAAPAQGDRIAALKDLADLKAEGILTDAEFEAEKARILGS